MENRIGIVGHVDSGKTTLSAAIITSLNMEEKEKKTINEIIEEQQTLKITAPPEIPLIQWDFKSSKENRRERRAKERKQNKLKKNTINKKIVNKKTK